MGEVPKPWQERYQVSITPKQTDGDDKVIEAKRLTDRIRKKEGRRPRIMIAKMGQDGHDRVAKSSCTAYADMGFDVDMGRSSRLPEETATSTRWKRRSSIIGMSSLPQGT